MSAAETSVREIVDRETRAWDTQDAELLLSLLHPDMVWPWPPDARAHDPIDWVLPLGRFNRDRWRRGWQDLFDSHALVHNRRTLQGIRVSAEEDGAFAVVDVDTLWRHRQSGVEQRWQGRACKIYTTVNGEWKMIAQTGLLDYGPFSRAGTR